MFSPTRDADASVSALHLVPVPALLLPAGFRRWRDTPPAPASAIKAVLTRPSQYKLARGNSDEILARHPGWSPHGWQRLPAGQVLPPQWRAFPEALPAANVRCCVLFFDLRGEASDCRGSGRYRGGWPFGDFDDRASDRGDAPPTDAARWAPYAWCTEQPHAMRQPDAGMDVRDGLGGAAVAARWG